ncbi:MAG: cytochrome b/b6 domain-containing protein [Gammaproteobacteria bacterium]
MPVQENSTGQWSRPLRTIHLLLAIAVTAQLFIGSFMRSPHPHRPDTFGFMSHEVLGATILVLIAVHWLWSFTHPQEGLHHLFPWTRTGLRNVANELWRAIRYQGLPPGGPRDASLAGLVHGLGLLAITAMVVTGGTFYFARLAGASWHTLDFIENDIHDVFAVIAWIYWGGHLGATVIHSLLRQPVWRRMFSLSG